MCIIYYIPKIYTIIYDITTYNDSDIIMHESNLLLSLNSWGEVDKKMP